ncbi:MAG: insulinase family protein [Bacteroidota bacterium]
MAIVVVGDVDVAKTLQMIDEKFGKIPAPEEGVRERKLYPVPVSVEAF